MRKIRQRRDALSLATLNYKQSLSKSVVRKWAKSVNEAITTAHHNANFSDDNAVNLLRACFFEWRQLCIKSLQVTTTNIDGIKILRTGPRSSTNGKDKLITAKPRVPFHLLGPPFENPTKSNIQPDYCGHQLPSSPQPSYHNTSRRNLSSITAEIERSIYELEHTTLHIIAKTKSSEKKRFYAEALNRYADEIEHMSEGSVVCSAVIPH